MCDYILIGSYLVLPLQYNMDGMNDLVFILNTEVLVLINAGNSMPFRTPEAYLLDLYVRDVKSIGDWVCYLVCSL